MLAALGAGRLHGASAAAEETVKVGIARSTSNAAELMALKHGYFKEAGIKLEWDDIDTTANVIALLAQNQFQIVAGGISAGIFNALEKDLPITILSDRVSTPIGHNLMLRPDLKDTVKSLKDLKGRSSPATAHGSVSTYEIGKMLESDGLSSPTSTSRSFRSRRWASRFKNKAIDAALAHPAVHLESRSRDRGSVRRRRRFGAAAADDHRRHHGQHRLGEGQPGAGAQLHDGVAARRARLLPSLSRRAEPQGDHRRAGQHQDRAAAGSCWRNILAGAQPERQDQHRQHARHQQPGT